MVEQSYIYIRNSISAFKQSYPLLTTIKIDTDIKGFFSHRFVHIFFSCKSTELDPLRRWLVNSNSILDLASTLCSRATTMLYNLYKYNQLLHPLLPLCFSIAPPDSSSFAFSPLSLFLSILRQV